MDWMQDADSVSNVIATGALVTSLLLGVPSIALSMRANKNAKAVARREIGRDAGPQINLLVEITEDIFRSQRQRDYDSIALYQSNMHSVSDELQAILVDYPDVREYIADMRTYLDEAISTLTKIDSHNLLKRWFAADGHQDTCENCVNSIRLQVRDLKVNVFNKTWIKDAHKRLRERGDKVLTASSKVQMRTE